MRMSRMFGRTLRQVPAEAETANHQLLLKAGLIGQLAAGLYSYLPLAWRAVRKVETVIRQEMNAIGGQEVLLPALQPLELWQESGRDGVDILFRLKDRRDRDFVLGPTHEEVITDLVRRTVQSYRDLPLVIYQIQTKFRDEPRPRGGLSRVREFIMKDAYSFHTDAASLDETYRAMAGAYSRIYERCGLNAVSVDADSGAIGGKDSKEFMLLTDSGEDDVIVCPICSYAANAERATFTKPDGVAADPLPMETVSTPHTKTIADVARLLGVETCQTLKCVLYSAGGEIVMALIRGDLDVNEVKLRNKIDADVRLASDDELRAAGIVKGFCSPVGLSGVRVIADDSITLGANFVAGANAPDAHLKNVNYPRDFAVELVDDIALAMGGEACPHCGRPLERHRGVELGHVFKLNTRYSEPMHVTFLDRDGTEKMMLMGCYGIGVGRLLASIIEGCHDDKGIRWPTSVAPYHVQLLALDVEDAAVTTAANGVYDSLRAAGWEVLYDDRPERPGVKFNDADLLGMPVRVTISKRTLARDSVAEVKLREEAAFHDVPIADLPAAIDELLAGREILRVD